MNVNQIQLLSHQYLIATKIELFSGVGDSYETARFKRLGYLSLDSNQRSNFRARELKSVYVDAAGSFLKFRVHRCYLNNQNHTNQVSIVAISVLGGLSDKRASDFALQDAPKARGAASAHDLGANMAMDPDTAEKLREVQRLKREAVDAEDYAAAKQYKQVETRIKESAKQLAALHIEKKKAVEDEDYDLAKVRACVCACVRVCVCVWPRHQYVCRHRVHSLCRRCRFVLPCGVVLLSLLTP